MACKDDAFIFQRTGTDCRFGLFTGFKVYRIGDFNGLHGGTEDEIANSGIENGFDHRLLEFLSHGRPSEKAQ
jgi:hypothetical protein